MLREGLMKGVEVQHTDFGTEQLEGKDGRETRMSSISIRFSLPEKGSEEGF
jgi:DNA-binding protein